MNFRLSLFTLLFSFLLFSAKAQVNIDSLKQSLEELPDDSTTLKKIVESIEVYRKIDITAAMVAAEAAYTKTLNDADGLMHCRAAYLYGIVYLDISNFLKATEYITEALKIAEKHNYKNMLVRCNNGLGNVFAMQYQGEKAIEFYKKSLVYSKQFNVQSNNGVVLGNIGNIYYQKTRKNISYLDSALVYYKQAAAQHLQNGDTSHLINIYCSFGLVYGDKKEYDLGLHYLAEAKKMIDRRKVKDDLANYYSYMGRISLELGDFEKAIDYQSKCLSAAKEMDDHDFISETYLALSDVYERKKDFEQAYRYYLMYSDLQDSLVNSENFSKVADIENRYEREKKQNEIEILQLKGKRDKVITYASIAGAILLLLSILLLYNRYKIKNRSHKLLEDQNAVISQKNKDITDSINYAKKIQEAMLPTLESVSKSFSDSFILFLPRDIVSGDFYWVSERNGIKLMAIADCTGHGVPGALMSMIGNSLLNQIVNERNITEPASILNELRKEIITALKQRDGDSSSRDGMDISLIAVHADNTTIEYAGANNPLYIVNNKQLREIKADKQPIGIFSGEPKPFTNNTFKVQKGDCIYLLSDGFADQFGGEKGKKFKYAKLKQLLAENSSLPSHEQKIVLEKNFNTWKESYEQVDDVLVAGIRV